MNNLDIKYNFKDGAKWDLPVYLNRQNPIPLDGTSVYKTLEEAQTYATSDPKAYPGQIISVVTKSEVKVYKINNGKLEELGKGSLVTNQNPKLLATADNIGQIIYLTTQVIVGKDTYSPGPYIVSGDGIVSKIGTTSASGDIAADVAVLQGKVGTLESTVGKKGTGSDNPSTGLVKDVEDLAKKDTELTDQITILSKNVDKIKVKKLTSAENGFAATYEFTDATGGTVNINIPKDQFLKSVTYVDKAPDVEEGNSTSTTFPALRFEWQFADKTITKTVTYVSVSSLIGSETDANSILGKIKDINNKATAANTTATEAKAAATEAKTIADANTNTLAGHTTSIEDLTSKVNKNIRDIATNAGNITKNADAIATNTAAINKNTAAIGTQAVVTPATIAKQFTGLVPDTNNTYFLADGAGKPVAVDDIKEGGIYYIYKKTYKYNSNPDDEQKVTISIVRQAEAGEGKDFTYPTTSSEATGLYQYIDNHIKNFDLSWQILD